MGKLSWASAQSFLTELDSRMMQYRHFAETAEIAAAQGDKQFEMPGEHQPPAKFDLPSTHALYAFHISDVPVRRELAGALV